jgi:hypothetical protein
MTSLAESNLCLVEETLLQDVTDRATFLETLKTSYQMQGIGEGLSFVEVEAYWQNGTALSDAWLDALARSIRCERPQGGLEWPQNNKLNSIKSALLEGLDPSEWFAVAERTIYLLSPLLAPERLVSWVTYNKDCSSKKIKSGVWCASFVEGLMPLAQALAKGEGAWQAVSSWMAEAGADTGVLLHLLEKTPTEKWRAQDDYSRRLSEQFTLLVLMRLLLRVQAPDDASWGKWLFPVSGLMSGYGEYPVDNADHRAWQRTLVAPILRAALTASDFVPQICEKLSRNEFSNLINDLGLGIQLAQQPEQYQALLEAVNENQLWIFRPSNELAETAPDLLFHHVRRFFERLGKMAFPKFSTPEALVWYQERLADIQDEEVLVNCVDWLIQRLSPADGVVMLEQFCNQRVPLSYRVLKEVEDVDALVRFLGCTNTYLNENAASRLARLAIQERQACQSNDYQYEPKAELWPLLIEQSKRYPDLFAEATLSTYRLHPQELERWELLWHSTSNAASRMNIAETLFDACKRDERVEGVDPLAMAERLYQDDPKPFLAFIDDQHEGYLDTYITAISDRETTLWELIPKMASLYLMQSTWISGSIEALDPVPVQKALTRYPESYTELEEKAKLKLIPFFNDKVLIACGGTLSELFAKASKALYQPAIELITRSTPDALRESGLLELSGKKARKLMLTGLALNETEDAGPILRELIDDKAHDDFSRGLMLDNLEARGESVVELDDWSDLTIEQVQGLAAKKKIPAAVTKLWNADLAACLSDLGEPGGLYLLSLISGGNGEQLPRKARQILELIPAGRRGDFALLGINQWIAENGSDKLKALLPPLFEYGDERVANELVKACKAWKKTRKQKSSTAIRLLCRIPGNYGIAQAHALWESRQFSESIMNNARLALSKTAAQAGMSFQEFIEQLVPDFGLKPEGLVLDVGPYSYQVKIKPDLSLMVVGPNGKTTKSFPKAKADEDPDKRSLAENQFKGLRKNLKPVLKQQNKRLMRGFTAGKRWDLALWQKLFLDHPLMNIIAQGVVWGAEDGKGSALVRFRPSDTGELLDLQDEPVSLDGAELIHIIHPAEVDGEERTAWQTHFKDYGVVSPIGQWEVPVYEASAEELMAERVTRQGDAVINRGTFAGLMEKWGYLKGSGEDGGWFYHHDWLVSHEAWMVTCQHSNVSVVFEVNAEVTVEALMPYRYASEEGSYSWKPVALKDLPIALRATLLAQAEALISAAIA